MSASTITLLSDGRPKTYDRSRLATAMLVYLDQAAGNPISLSVTHRTAALLRTQHHFDTDAIMYAIGAMVALETGVEP